VSFRCRIVGAGEQELALRRQIAEAGLTGHVELAGPRPQREIIALLQGAAVLAAPCVVGADGDRDGMPTVLLEAMAVGTPCVATPVTGIPEVVRDGETGLLVAERDAEGLAGALARLLRDGALRLALASAARRRMEQDFDVAANAARQRTIFGVCRDQRLPRDTGSAREGLSLAGAGKEVR
jgi:glycosyltransferase involved in cell wall biosynthesis